MGGGEGEDRLALSRGQARQLLAHTLIKDVSLSTQPDTHKCLKQSSVEGGTAVVRVQDNRPSYQQQDRQTVW